MTKRLIQNISHRTKLRNIFLKIPTDDNKLAYYKQRNKCVNLLRKEKTKYLNLNNVMDNKLFWKTAKLPFSENSFVSKKIVLVENEDVLTNDHEVAETLNTFFCSAVKVCMHT